MKLSYEYFLQRRKLTTRGLILSNQIKNYSEFIQLLNRLKVQAPAENIFHEAYSEVSAIHQTKKERKKRVVKTNDDIQKKETAASMSKAGSASRKGRSSRTSRKSRSILKEKPSDS